MVDEFHQVPSYDNVDESKFSFILKENKPAIIRSCTFGDCMTKWTLDYLTEKLGDYLVTIHCGNDANLEFINKNYQYRSCKFSDFAQLLQSNEQRSYVYLRSTNKNPRTKRPARIEDDFPAIANDMKPASFIPYGSQNQLYHSSVLRIASPNVQIWTHFDIYDNILCQVYGTKRVVLLPPRDIRNLYVIGDKSPVNEFDDLNKLISKYPLISNADLYECRLKPGDALFIPALWWHNIKTIGENQSSSVGFNIFWRDTDLADCSFYADNDIYGNKDPVPFNSALTNLDKAISHLERLPGKYRNFYKCMLLERMKSKLSIME